jgi:tetratricopeptide (TPR) repeat protein
MAHPRTLPLTLLAAAVPLWAGTALADEIVVRHPDSCERTTLKVAEILPETWSEVEYREKERGPAKKVPMEMVVEIRRGTARQQEGDLKSAIEELDRGSLAEARKALENLTGGGWKLDLSTNTKNYKPFTSDDPAGKKRPTWVSEYAHFHLAKALYLDGTRSKNDALVEEALLALDDVPIPGGDGKATTGGFLGRFKGGNSRWLPEAMLLRAHALVALGRHDEALKAYEDLGNAAASVPLPRRWAYEAKLGPGRVAEAKGQDDGAIIEYDRAAQLMDVLVRDETRRCVRLELGRYYSRARTEAARIMLRQAEKAASPPAFAKLREFIEKGSADALRSKFASRSPGEIEAFVAGARDPEVQAVAQNGLGLAYLNEGRLEEALVAFRSVAVRYFQVPGQPAMALFYLAKTADQAAQKAKAADKARYEQTKEKALQELRETYPGSEWARR